MKLSKLNNLASLPRYEALATVLPNTITQKSPRSFYKPAAMTDVSDLESLMTLPQANMKSKSKEQSSQKKNVFNNYVSKYSKINAETKHLLDLSEKFEQKGISRNPAGD